MTIALLTLGWMAVVGAALLFFLSKAYFLAPHRIGVLMLLPNAVYETAERRGGMHRERLDVALLLLVPIGVGLLAGPWFGLACALLCGAAWAAALFVELRWRADAPATQDMRTPRTPLPIPKLIVNVRGPVLERDARVYRLGHWPAGLSQEFELLILNPGTVRPQLPLAVEANCGAAQVQVEFTGERPVRCPEPGRLVRAKLRIAAVAPGAGADILVRVSHGDRHWERTLRIDSVLPAEIQPVAATITRWKYGAGGAFNWRGDHDLYDPSTFQSTEGLRTVLGLAARFRMPTSIMLSARLSLDRRAHEEFCRHFGWDRHSEEVPQFIRFLREEVDTRLEQEFPIDEERPLSAEIANHCYLHYGTHAAADPGNGWTSHARMGAGKYDWMSAYPCDSLTEQRDNMRKGSQVLFETLGITPVSYTIPSDVLDEFTPRAVEAAGLEVSSETDTTKLQKLLFFPRQHHPEGCERLVDLTRVLPRDPLNAAQIAMLKYWVGVARRTGRAMVYLAHHHVVLYQTNACFNLTAELLRYVLADMEGEIWCGTLAAIGRYWRDVLSERTRCVRIECIDGRVVVHNGGARRLEGLPLEVDYGQGRRCMRLIDLEPHSELELAGGSVLASIAPARRSG